MFGDLAAGSKIGGYNYIEDTVAHMASYEKKSYLSVPENVEVYNQLFTEYRKLHDYFDRGGNQAMERLKRKL